VDLFIEPHHKILAKNLKILKLNAEDLSFGALVPEKKSEFLQLVFSQKNLVAAIKNSHSAQAEFFIQRQATLKSSLLNIPVED
jgi:hypothetical protein